jgi:hypothetical protein
MDWAAKIAASKPRVYVVHGEEKAGETLAARLRKELGLDARLPVWHEAVDL